MHMDQLLRLTGWSAYLSALATILTFVTGILFFTLGQAFGKFNDLSSVFQLLFMLPLPIVLSRLLPADSRILGWLALLFGISGMLISLVGQTMLVIGRIDFTGSLKFFPAGAAIGVWLILLSALAMAGKVFPAGLAWAGMLAGLGYIVTVVGFLLGGQQNVFFYIGGLMLGIIYPLWAIWLGRLLLAGTLIKAAG